MISATFIFKKKQFDDAFHALDNHIAAFAKQTTGYLGEETWENPSNGLISNVYYWRDKVGLDQLINHPAHLKAKQQQSTWLDGYHIIIAEVLDSYGDGKLSHPTFST